MIKKTKIKESDLSSTVRQFLYDKECDKTYGEVFNIDIVGITKDNTVFGVEMKTSLSIKVCEQAYDRLKLCDYVYIAVPDNKKITQHSISIVYKNFFDVMGIGLITIKEPIVYDNKTLCRYTVVRQANKTENSIYKNNLLKNLPANAENRDGGLQSYEVFSDYKWMIEQVKDYMKEQRNINPDSGWLSVTDILEKCRRVTDHYVNPKSSLSQTLQAKWNSSWIEIDKENKKYRHR